MNVRGFIAITLLVSFAGLSGCREGASGGSRKPVYDASGTVKLFGAPLPEATVTFAPLDGQPTAFGTTDDSGTFKLTTYDFGDGAAAGKYKVIITKFAGSSKTAAAANTSDHEAAEKAAGGHDATGAASGAKALVPPAFTSLETTTLSAEVTSGGDNSFPFELK
jgi:hypothetical protein